LVYVFFIFLHFFILSASTIKNVLSVCVPSYVTEANL